MLRDESFRFYLRFYSARIVYGRERDVMKSSDVALCDAFLYLNSFLSRVDARGKIGSRGGQGIRKSMTKALSAVLA